MIIEPYRDVMGFPGACTDGKIFYDLYKEVYMLEFKDWGAYAEIEADGSTLDGTFTSTELRTIADSMDEMKDKELK